jgi:DNA-binding transcriptional regulator YiaG
MTTNEELKKIRTDNNLSAKQIAELLLCAHRTAQRWLQKESSSSYRHMPPAMLELLKIKLKIKK